MGVRQCWCGQVHDVSGPAPFGWTVVLKGGIGPVVVYKRDTPADAAHFAADLAPYTFPTKGEAVAQGALGNYAYGKVYRERQAEAELLRYRQMSARV